VEMCGYLYADFAGGIALALIVAITILLLLD
jgi:hypothetical protein